MTEVPTTLLTGYLGAGKTTLLNRILTERHGQKFAVIVNDFGEINIDSEIISDTASDLVEMANGCLCCTAAVDLVPTLTERLPYADGLDGILIEASGLANPAQVAQAFFFAEVRENAKLDAIVAVVDASTIETVLRQCPEAGDQIACADIVLLNKVDLTCGEECTEAMASIKRLAPGAEIVPTRRCNVSLDVILGRGAFSIERIEDLLPTDDDHQNHHQAHLHESRISSVALRADQPVNAEKFMPWMQGLMISRGADILRCKGILWFHDDEYRFVFQGVNMMLEGDTQRAWQDGEVRSSKLVIIGRNLKPDDLRAGFENCLVERY